MAEPGNPYGAPAALPNDKGRARRAAWASLATAVAFWVVAWLFPGIREFAIVAGLCFFFLIGGVISWDSRGGH